ncbi:MAG: PilZ domain-containing protein, partial [Desulfobacteraceae bacterium]|nr:PilZ domain-containing protein [Desulfobacteraceae bacterium]
IRITSTFQGYKTAYVDTLAEAEEKFENAARRHGLRFQMHRRLIEYCIKDQDGQGYVVDISISGCAVQAPTVSPGVNDEISLVIPLHHDYENISSFRLKAIVVRVEKDLFAARFLDLDDEQQAHFYQCLSCEALR